MIAGKPVLLYDWFDIQQEICNKLGIEKEQFRSYHNVGGAGIMDLWHLTLDSLLPDEPYNGAIMTLFRFGHYGSLPDEKLYYQEKYGEWIIPFFDAFNEIMEEIDPKHKGVLVSIGW